MSNVPRKSCPEVSVSINRAGYILLLSALIGFLGAVGYFVYMGLVTGDGSVSIGFYVAMAFGVIFSLIVGIGLMTLVFYSSRHGFDEPPTLDDGQP